MARHPGIGETIGEYKVVELLGVGGLGVVFKVERAGRAFAMKFLSVDRLDGRAKREIAILNHLTHPCVVRYIGSDYWPDPVTGHPFIIMEHVPGPTLDAYALKHNPSARKATRIILDVARTLGEVHAEGVFHRDLKPSNIIIRGAAERPVLIDFGIASLVGAVCLTGSRIPPGTEEFRAPEPLRFERGNPNGAERYEFGVLDELWALGVTLYWILTDELPFGELPPSGERKELHERILHQRPPAPHVVNPRVPVALSRVCMKMLSEWPAERYPNVPELCAALEGALKAADDDPAWDVPLFDPNDAQLTTTVDDPALREPNEVLRAYNKAGKWRPRRGQVPPKDDPPSSEQAEHAEPVAMDEDQDRTPTVDAPRDVAPLGEQEPPAVAPPVLPGREQLAPSMATHPRRARWLLGLVAALVTVGAVAVNLGFWRLGDGAGGTTGMVGLERPSPELAWTLSTDWDFRGNEVAIPWEPLQSVVQASVAPVRAQPPKLAVNAMSTPTTTETSRSQKQRTGLRLPLKGGTMAAALLAGCTGVGCTATNNQVRPEPPAISCPQDWRKTHEQFDVEFGTNIATVKRYKGEPGEVVRVKDGRVTLQVGISGRVGKLPVGTLLLGQWQLGDNRLFGTFTEAKIPGVGTVPVCLVAGLKVLTGYVDEHGKNFDCPSGLGVCLDPGSTPGNVKTHTRVYLIEPVGQP
ncbi:serine/threonine protein kinase [Cystobacter ferrugineus]|uniref:serine/threonine protein kinase n=1 Tax=Cystobacter ferrugineus TaxID=83449 RepID=UPI001651499E|nr:serine/threonine-protein kinase [Cystobacter ferrugineus]